MKAPLLSKRELETLRLRAAGHQNKVVAEMLGISINTVKDLVFRIFAKFGASSMELIVLRAERLGLLEEVDA